MGPAAIRRLVAAVLPLGAAVLPVGMAITGCSHATRTAGSAPAPEVQAAASSSAQMPEQQAGARAPTGNPADVQFMSGMIIHHEQAVLMAGWAPTHDAGPGVATLCRKIAVSQHDDIALMERWLREHGQPLPDTAWVFDYTGPGMAHAHLMDGMLTVDQLTELDAARGQEFDRLFLKYMIQHHTGALTMVQTLLTSPTAGQDGLVFQFASDINSDQMVEIARMRQMLAALPADDQRS